MMKRVLTAGLMFTVALLGRTADVPAQGLIWSLPEDGAWVRYEGTYRQIEHRPDAVEGNVTIDWIRHLTISSVGQEQAEYNGETVSCRWIEIKVLTGESKEGVIDPGPAGARLYKVLVPESKVVGRTVDDDNIPFAFLPIVRGFRQVGEGEAQPIAANVLQVSPTLSLLTHYRALGDEGEEDVEVPLGTVTARKLTGEVIKESPAIRSTNEATLWQSDEVPFGLAKWEVRMLRETKQVSDPRSGFEPATEVVEEMSAHAVGSDAQSELVAP